jgi:hypothetical protein
MECPRGTRPLTEPIFTVPFHLCQAPTKNVGEFSEDDVETADSDDTDEELLLSTSTSAQ